MIRKNSVTIKLSDLLWHKNFNFNAKALINPITIIDDRSPGDGESIIEIFSTIKQIPILKDYSNIIFRDLLLSSYNELAN